ncbi:MAG: hypothetical protein M5U16_13120 [Hyphomicrobium sp.]|nr:hypothetical protein [Hyphomicrobium sp.]
MSHTTSVSASGVRSFVRVRNTSANVAPSIDSISTSVNTAPTAKSSV